MRVATQRAPGAPAGCSGRSQGLTTVPLWSGLVSNCPFLESTASGPAMTHANVARGSSLHLYTSDASFAMPRVACV